MTAIGISGFAGSGKTTAAQYLETTYAYKRLHIAEPLRDMLRTLLTDFGMASEEITRYLTGDLKEDVIPCLGVTSRHAQISLGTEWGREQISPDLWANCWKVKASQSGKPMNDSVRFPNEETAIRDLNGFTILITRPGYGPAAFKGRMGRWLYQNLSIMWGVHDSERVDRLNPDYTIINSGTQNELYQMLDWVMDDGPYSVPPVIRPEMLR